MRGPPVRRRVTLCLLLLVLCYGGRIPNPSNLNAYLPAGLRECPSALTITTGVPLPRKRTPVVGRRGGRGEIMCQEWRALPVEWKR